MPFSWCHPDTGIVWVFSLTPDRYGLLASKWFVAAMLVFDSGTPYLEGIARMNADKVLRRLVALVLTSGLLLPGVRAAEVPTSGAPVQKANFGTIVGIIRNAAKAPVGGATITAARADGSAIRATVSGSDGVYSFADVAPGAWSVSSQADGYLDTAATAIEVVGAKATRTDIVIAANTPAQPAIISSTQSAPPPR
jgi:hypothetical protein